MAISRGEFTKIFRIEVAKAILVTVIFVAMIIAGELLLQTRIRHHEGTLRNIDQQIRLQFARSIEREELLRELTKQGVEQTKFISDRTEKLKLLCEKILKNQDYLITSHDVLKQQLKFNSSHK